MSDVVIKVENVSKQYRLGKIGTGSLRHDLNRWLHLVRGKEDPYLKIGEVNDRTKKGDSEYVWALQDINFEVKMGEVLGIIGRNGAGKSTLLKILSRTTLPTTGQIKTRGRIASLLEVGTGFHPELTGRENIFLNGAILGMRKAEIQSKLDEIIDFSGVERYIDTPVKRYSSGMYVRLAFAVAAHLESEILIVDEVLAVGDAEFQKKCLGKMGEVSRGEGRTVLFVSHNLQNIINLCSTCLLLSHGTSKGIYSVDEGINKYLYGPLNSLSYQNPLLSSIQSPCITYANLKIDEENFSFTIYFESPFILKNVILGIVVYDNLKNPIFGLNNRFDKNARIKFEKKKGKILVNLDKINLYSGNYFVSLFLGDDDRDYFIADEAIGFMINNGEVIESKKPSNLKTGSLFPKYRTWQFFDS